jgi:uncharacterized membrane protein
MDDNAKWNWRRLGERGLVVLFALLVAALVFDMLAWRALSNGWTETAFLLISVGAVVGLTSTIVGWKTERPHALRNANPEAL